jgi:hypothetical protein
MVGKTGISPVVLKDTNLIRPKRPALGDFGQHSLPPAFV